MVRPIYNVYVGLGAGLGVGVAAVISRNIGAARPKDASASAIQAIIIGFLFALALTPVMFFLQPGLDEDRPARNERLDAISKTIDDEYKGVR